MSFLAQRRECTSTAMLMLACWFSGFIVLWWKLLVVVVWVEARLRICPWTPSRLMVSVIVSMLVAISGGSGRMVP